MKKKRLIFLVVIICMFFIFIQNHKECAKTVYWDGKSTLGEPAIVMFAKYYNSRWDFQCFRQTSDPKVIREISQELYGDEQITVPSSDYSLVYMAPNGSHMIISIFIDHENEIILSPKSKSNELWKIYESIPNDSIPKPVFPGVDVFDVEN